MTEREAHFFWLYCDGAGGKKVKERREEASENEIERAGPCGPVSHTTVGLPPRRCVHMYPAHSRSTSRSSRMISLDSSAAQVFVGRCALLLAVVLFLGRPVDSLGSCKEAGLCCTGRDASCVVQKTPQNAIIEDLRDTPCYCDHACLKLNDCCPDYRQTCGGTNLVSFFFLT